MLVESVGDETVVYDLQSKDAHCLKPLAAIVFAKADGETSTTQIAALAQEQLGHQVTEREVSDAIEQLEQSSLLDSPIVVRNGNGVSRREAVRRFAFAGAAVVGSTPLITTIISPTAAMALSNIPPGCSGCKQNKDCRVASGCPGDSAHCCQSSKCGGGCCADCNNSCQVCTVGSVTSCTVTLLNGCPTSCPGGSQVCCTAQPAC